MVSSRRFTWIVIVTLFVAYAGLRVVMAPSIVDKPRVLADTTAYERISRYGVFSRDLWAASRPPMFPLLLKAAGQDFDRAAAFQLALAIPAWGLLALAISRALTYGVLQVTGFTLVLLFSLERHIAGWDFVMMSESLSITTLALFVAACLWLQERWRRERVAAVFVSAFLLAFTRDTNAWMLLALGALLAAAVGLRWARRGSLILAAGFVCLYAASDASAHAGNRWVFPLGNVITQRVLVEPSARAYFEGCGMPVTPELLQLAGKFANSDDQALFNGPGFEPLRRWLYDHGKGCYVTWLIAHPMHQAWEALLHMGSLVAFDSVDRFFSNRYFPVLPRWLEVVLYPPRFTLWIWVLSTVAALWALWGRAWRNNRLWAAFICMNLLVFPHIFLTWHGDSMAPDRHALSVGVQLYLGLWLLLLLLAWQGAQRLRTAGEPTA